MTARQPLDFPLTLVADDWLCDRLGLASDEGDAAALLRSTERTRSRVLELVGLRDVSELVASSDEPDASLLHTNELQLMEVGRHAAAVMLTPLLRRTVCGRQVAELERELGGRAFAYGLVRPTHPDMTERHGRCEVSVDDARAEPLRCLRAWADDLAVPLREFVSLRFDPTHGFHASPAAGRSSRLRDRRRARAFREAAASVISIVPDASAVPLPCDSEDGR